MKALLCVFGTIAAGSGAILLTDQAVSQKAIGNFGIAAMLFCAAGFCAIAGVGFAIRTYNETKK